MERYIPPALRHAVTVAGAAAGKKIAITGTGTNTALPLFDTGKQCRVFVVTPTVPCLVLLGASGSSAVSTTVFHHYLSAASYILEITDGAQTHIDIVAEPAASGSVYVAPLQWNVPA